MKSISGTLSVILFRSFLSTKPAGIIFVFLILCQHASAQYQMEKLDRGVVAVRTGSNNFISWRWLGTEPESITFNLYRNGTKVNANPLTVCNYTDNGAPANASYTVSAIVNGTEQAASAAVTPWAQQYMRVGIQSPGTGYVANDASIADLDGDGQWEIILKWDPADAKDNSQSGVTGNVYIDAYKLNGTRLWRINLGRNIRAGAHYTQFMVYDFNSDGKAEMMCKTSDGTVDGKGVVIGNATADYRNSGGYILTGPEFLTVFNGQTGAAMATVNYLPGRGTVSAWGDNYGNRVDRFRAGVAYLDGKKPSAIFCRGYYTRMVIAAYDWNGTVLSSRWVFDSGNSNTNPFYGQGNHSLSIADVDNDGKHEIISGSAIIDDNGTGYYSTGFGHGDAGHVSDLDPSLPGLEVFNIQERFDKQGCYMYSARDKKVLWTKPSVAAGEDGEGPGRGVCADISAAYPGAESWVAGAGITGVFDCKGNVTGLATPPSCNFLVWWDGDPLRELLNNTMIDKYGTGRLLTAYNLAPVASNNGSKSTPSLSGDFFGDWREEVIWRSSANDALYIFTTTIPSNMKLRTLMHDPQYRTAIAWQNTAYNQPPHVSYFIGNGMTPPPAPNIVVVESGNPSCNASITTGGSTTFCSGGSVMLTASAGASYKWFNGTTQVGTSAAYTATAAGSYTVEVTAASGCKATSAATAVTVNALPVITPYTQINGGAWSQVNTATLCAAGNVVFGPQPTAAAGWSWKGPGSYSAVTREISLSGITSIQSGTYTATYTDANGCKANADFILTVHALPTATVSTSGSTTICQGAVATLSASSGSTYVWKNGTVVIGTNQTFNANTSGSYTVEVTNANNCKAVSAPVVVTVNAPSTWYQDTDNDGKGDPAVTQSACTQPAGYVAAAGDACPADANKTAAGNCGCGNTEGSCLDCAGIPNGTATLDQCSICVGGTTGKTACVTTPTIHTLEGTALTVSPLPFEYSTTLKLENGGTIQSVTIINSTGALVSSLQHVNSADIQIGDGLSAGMYTLLVESDKGIFTTRIVKIK